MVLQKWLHTTSEGVVVVVVVVVVVAPVAKGRPIQPLFCE